MEKINVYNFNINGDKYYFVCRNPLKESLHHRYNLDELHKITAYLEQNHPSIGIYEHNFNLCPGTILDNDYNVIYSPAINYVTELQNDDYIKYDAVDGTHINIYYIKGKRYIGTKNSWDISNINDIFSETYAELLQETLDMLDIDELPTGTYIFCNPKVHLLAHQFKIYDLNLCANPNESSVFSALVKSETIGECIRYYAKYNAYVEDISKELKGVNNLLYLHRNRFYSKDSRLALLHCICNLYCFGAKYKRYLSKTKCLNSLAFAAYKYLHELKKELMQNILTDTFYNVVIPKRFNKHNCFKPVYKNFWFNVLANAIVVKQISFLDFELSTKTVDEQMHR